MQNEETKAENDRVELLMVEYYLSLAHDQTVKSYSNGEYKANREALSEEAKNIQKVLKICCKEKDPNSTISVCLTNSNVFTSSGRHFSLFVRTVVPGVIVDKFLEWCAKLAEEWNNEAEKINFNCLLADQERVKTVEEPSRLKDLDKKMDEIKREFDKHHRVVKRNESIYAHYLYVSGRYLLHKSKNQEDKERLNMQNEAREQLQKSLELREKFIHTAEGRADVVFTLLSLGKAEKKFPNQKVVTGIQRNTLRLRKTHKSCTKKLNRWPKKI